jgi:hypothetical protein
MIPLSQAATMGKSGLTLPVVPPTGRPSEHSLASQNTARRQGKGGGGLAPSPQSSLPKDRAACLLPDPVLPIARRRSSVTGPVTSSAVASAAAASVARRGSLTAIPPARGASFFDWLEASSGGRFHRSALEGTSFVYLQVGCHLYDLKISTGIDCGAVCASRGSNTDAQAQLSARFVILSAQGLTCHINGDVSFVSRDRFELEWSRYQQLMSRNFFRSFRAWRVFEFWKRGLRQRRFAARRAALQRSLFTMDATLRPALLEMRRYCLQIANLKLFVIEPITHSLREWLEQQEQARHAVAAAFGETFGDVRRLVLYSAAVSLERHMRELGLESSTGEQLIPLPHDSAALATTINGSSTGAAATGLGVAPKYFTMFAMPKDLRYTTRAAARTQCHRLLRFVRLADLSLWASLQVRCDILPFAPANVFLTMPNPPTLFTGARVFIVHSAALINVGNDTRRAPAAFKCGRLAESSRVARRRSRPPQPPSTRRQRN